MVFSVYRATCVFVLCTIRALVFFSVFTLQRTLQLLDYPSRCGYNTNIHIIKCPLEYFRSISNHKVAFRENFKICLHDHNNLTRVITDNFAMHSRTSLNFTGKTSSGDAAKQDRNSRSAGHASNSRHQKRRLARSINLSPPSLRPSVLCQTLRSRPRVLKHPGAADFFYGAPEAGHSR